MNLLSPGDFVNNYSDIGAKKCSAAAGKLLMLSVLAGIFIALGGLVSSIGGHSAETAGAGKVIAGVLFPVGLIMVVLTGAELFTGNCLIAISLAERKVSFKAMVRNLILVFIGNFVGAALVAAVSVYCGTLSISGGQLAVYIIKAAATKCTLDFAKALVLGILCNLLVCSAVMMALCSKDGAGRALGAYVPVFTFVACGFEHSIANMFYIPAGLMAAAVPEYAQLASMAEVNLSGLTAGSFLVGNLLPVTLGNIIGGVGFALLMHNAHGPKKV